MAKRVYVYSRVLDGWLCRLTPFVVAALIIVAFASFGTVASAGTNHLYHYSTDYATIHYSDPAAHESFMAILKEGESKPRYANSIGSSVDRIVFRVRNILGVHTPGFHFNIYLLDNSDELKAMYREMGFTGKVPAAFYTRSTGSVFIALDELNDGVLAHEVAHAVINSHYTPPLPNRMQEILAQFVDKNLWVE